MEASQAQALYAAQQLVSAAQQAAHGYPGVALTPQQQQQQQLRQQLLQQQLAQQLQHQLLQQQQQQHLAQQVQQQQLLQQQAAQQQAAQQAAQGQPAQATAAQQALLQQQQAAQAAQATAAAPAQTVMQAGLAVAGGQNATVGGIVRGEYVAFAENHGKPVYKRTTQATLSAAGGGVNTLDVLIYFWDDRDGPAFCGWWFGPRVGGDQVWAYNAEKSGTPPLTNWKIPYDGTVDTSFSVSPATVQAPQQNEEERQRQLMQYYQQQQQAQKQEEERRLQEQQLQMRHREELHRKQQEEMQRRQIEEQRRQQEHQAMLTLRRHISRVRIVDEENFPVVRAEIEQVLAVEGPRCGSFHARMVDEVNYAFQQAAERFRLAAEQRAEEERRRLAREEMVAQLVQELTVFVMEAEAKVEVMKAKAVPLLNSGGEHLTEDPDVKQVHKEVAQLQSEAQQACKACTDFLVGRQAHLEEARNASEEQRMQLVPLQRRIHDALAVVVKQGKAAEALALKAVNRLKANRMLERRGKLFAQYDLDKDGLLSREELAAWAKAEYDFAMPADLIDRILQRHGGDNAKGLSKEMLPKVRMMMGVARELESQGQRRALAAKRGAEIKEKKGDFHMEILNATTVVDTAGRAIDDAESSMHGLPEEVQKVLDSSSGEGWVSCASALHGLVDRADEAAAASRLRLTEAAEAVSVVCRKEEQIVEADEEELRELLHKEAWPLTARCEALANRLAEVQQKAARLRKLAGKKDLADLDQCRTALRTQLRKRVKDAGKTLDELFVEADRDGDERVSKEDVLSLLFNGDALPETVDADRVGRLCSDIADDDRGLLTKDEFRLLAQASYKVCKQTVLTSLLVIKDGKTLLRLEEETVLVAEEEPVEEDSSKVTRVFCKAVKDGVEGWCSVCGNQGTQFLDHGGDIFKVALSVDLTRRLDGASAEIVRRLEDGELIQIIKGETKDPSSQEVRVKVRARSDGNVGWVTFARPEGLPNLRIV